MIVLIKTLRTQLNVCVCLFPISDSDIEGDSAKVYHRSLDLLEAWLADCRLVDFSPDSSLHNTLENFLTSKVAKQLTVHTQLV